MKILLLDIETSPILGYTWGLWKQNIYLDQIVEHPRVLGVSVKWLGQKSVRWLSEDKLGHEEMILKVHALMDEADAIVHYNGTTFDMPHLRREFIQAGLTPPAPHKDIDLMKVVKRQFRFASYKLAYVTEQLGLETKLDHSGFSMWAGCLAGDPKAWAEMGRYARRDTKILEPLYLKLLPWILNHPHQGLYVVEDEEGILRCPRCKSDRLQRRGEAAVRNYTYPRFQCQSCGGWSKGSKRERATEGSPL